MQSPEPEFCSYRNNFDLTEVRQEMVSCHTNRVLRTRLQVHRLKHLCAFAFSASGRKFKLPALKGRASRKGIYLFQIAPLKPALKGGFAGKRTGQATRAEAVS
jgi:hypothetical protein